MTDMGSSADTNEKQKVLRHLPKTDAVANDPSLDAARTRLGIKALTNVVRDALREARKRALETGSADGHDVLVAVVASKVEAVLGSRARRVINASGVVLHTNLGRAPLSQAAVDALTHSAAGYTSVEIDLASGRRGGRGVFAETALRQLSGADDALVVNNCAAAVLLILTALSRDRGVVVSRGELVQIGGGFRVPEVLARSGSRMIEVGTTNRTNLADYERALDEHDDVAVLLRVHRSNFRVTGFVEEPRLEDLAKLADDRGVLLVHDLGGGALVDLTPLGLDGEPVVRACVDGGAHLVSFSCDKLLGGPQGGAIVGRADLVEKVRRDPLARALRLGRLPLVALEATLAHYLEGDLEAVPAQRSMRASIDEVRTRVEGWCATLNDRGVTATTADVNAQVGGGTLAEQALPSVAVVITAPNIDSVARKLRMHATPVLARIHADRLLLDGRTVLPDEDDALLDAVIAALSD
jgi:L-seryl-tRNA(Ser) seleniumtransferase